MSLKDLTKEKHTDAERTAFAKLLMSGNITEKQYAQYLRQMLEVYSVLEVLSAQAGHFENLAGLPRAPMIYKDLQEFSAVSGSLSTLPSTKAYIDYLISMSSDDSRKHLLLAHLYVRHMGDLYGGQMIKKKVPGDGNFYVFNDRDGLIAKIREKLTDDLGEEANVAFDHAINIMKDLNEWCMEHAD